MLQTYKKKYTKNIKIKLTNTNNNTHNTMQHRMKKKVYLFIKTDAFK